MPTATQPEPLGQGAPPSHSGSIDGDVPGDALGEQHAPGLAPPPGVGASAAGVSNAGMRLPDQLMEVMSIAGFVGWDHVTLANAARTCTEWRRYAKPSDVAALGCRSDDHAVRGKASQRLSKLLRKLGPCAPKRHVDAVLDALELSLEQRLCTSIFTEVVNGLEPLCLDVMQRERLDDICFYRSAQPIFHGPSLATRMKEWSDERRSLERATRVYWGVDSPDLKEAKEALRQEIPGIFAEHDFPGPPVPEASGSPDTAD